MYILICIDSFRHEDHFWLEGETYTLERNDILAYQKIKGFFDHFEPKNAAAKELYKDE